MAIRRVLVVPYSDSLGHVSRSIAFVTRVLEAGLHVEVAGGGRWDHLFPITPFAAPMVPYPDLKTWLRHYLPSLPFSDGTCRSTRAPSISFSNAELDLEVLTSGWTVLLDRFSPDYVVVDGRPEVFWAAGALRIPLAGIFSYAWTEAFSARFVRGMKDGGHHPAASLTAFNAVGQRRGLPPVVDPWMPFAGVARLLPDTLEFVGPQIPKDCMVLGPLLFDPGTRVPTWSGTGPIVYVTSGTSSFPRLEQAAEYLRDRGVSIVFSGGLREEGTVPVSTSAVLGAASLVLCHGGSQTLYHAARAGIFSFVMPENFDHHRNGLLFEAHGFAEVLPAEMTARAAADYVCLHLKRTTGARLAPLRDDGGFDVGKLLTFLERRSATDDGEAGTRREPSVR